MKDFLKTNCAVLLFLSMQCLKPYVFNIMTQNVAKTPSCPIYDLIYDMPIRKFVCNFDRFIYRLLQKNVLDFFQEPPNYGNHTRHNKLT